MPKITGLILFGESVVAGRGVKDRSLSFGRLLRVKLPIPVLIKGKSYITSQDALNRLDKAVLRKHKIYSHVLVFIGNNDVRPVGFMKPKFTVEEFMKNVHEIIRRIQDCGKTVIMCNLQPLDDEDIYRIHPSVSKYVKPPITPSFLHKQYSDACSKIAQEAGVFFIDIRSELEKMKEKGIKVIADYCLDPNSLGHQTIAEKIITDLKAYNFI